MEKKSMLRKKNNILRRFEFMGYEAPQPRRPKHKPVTGTGIYLIELAEFGLPEYTLRLVECELKLQMHPVN
jgi:hypothetical protein